MFEVVKMKGNPDRIKDKDYFWDFQKLNLYKWWGFSVIFDTIGGRGKYERGPSGPVAAPEYILFNILFSLTKPHDGFNLLIKTY